jgi:hypothetical protein
LIKGASSAGYFVGICDVASEKAVVRPTNAWAEAQVATGSDRGWQEQCAADVDLGDPTLEKPAAVKSSGNPAISLSFPRHQRAEVRWFVTLPCGPMAAEPFLLARSFHRGGLRRLAR